MTNQDDANKVIGFYNDAARNYSERYDRSKLMTLEKYPANYFRLQQLLTRAAACGVRTLYDIGTGEGTPLMMLTEMGVDVYGCDIAPEMVELTRQKLANVNLPDERCIVADIEDAITLAPHLKSGPFDAVVAFGVLPHVKNDKLALENMRALAGENGKLFVEFRNKLFSLFTYNRYTRDFILDDLLAGVSGKVRDAVATELEKRCATDVPPLPESDNSYDTIPAKFHNPFELTQLIDSSGFKNARLHWYHYHPAPPMLAESLGDEFRKAAIDLEHTPDDWRGYFLCSAGFIEADAI